MSLQEKALLTLLILLCFVPHGFMVLNMKRWSAEAARVRRARAQDFVQTKGGQEKRRVA